MKHNAQLFSDFLVIGGGIAGLTFAIKASEVGTVTVLTKAGSSEANTSYAQGGIASVWSVDDSFESHIEDTLRAGAGLCDRNAVETIVREGPEAVRELIRLGTRFTKVENHDSETDGNDLELEYDLGKEGGHSHRRVLHAQDLTGREIMRALTEAAAARPNIRTLENHVAINLLVETPAAGKPGACWGVYALDRNTHEIRKVISRATMLATGGAGKVYLYTTNPDIASGDGVAMAYRAGAAVANLEFYQFHPTCLYHPAAKSFLISEALRGEGAILKLPDGTAFMKRYHPDAELAPRDVVARAIDSEMKRHGLDFVYLDLSHREADFIKRRFPNIFKRCLNFGYDLTKGPIPVVPAAHYMCGGVRTDLDGRTSIPRLYAAGEVAMTGLHGANRLASNSLLEAAVMGRRGFASAREIVASGGGSPPEFPEWDPGRAIRSEERVMITQSWDEIRRLMWNYVGIVRSDRRLERALRRILMVKDEIHSYYWDHLLDADTIELRNLAKVAELVVRSAMSRHESRGLHYNIDHPETGGDEWIHPTILQKPVSVIEMATKEVKMYSDYKSPFAYLAFDPAFALEQKFRIKLRWIPFQLRIKGKGERSLYSELKVRYSYLDARRWAGARGLVIRGPLKVYDTKPALIGGLFAEQQGRLLDYSRKVYELFFRRELEAHEPYAVAEVIASLGMSGDDYREYLSGEGLAAYERAQDEAAADQVFGVPLFVFEGEPFWGHDRIPILADRLTEAGLASR